MTRLRQMPGFVREAVLLELVLYGSLVRWIARRPDVPRGAVPIGYSRLVVPVLWLWIFGSAVEVIVVEVVLRQVDQHWAAALRLPLLVLGVWGVLWMLGMMASYQVRPHVLTDTDLRLRSGARTWVVVPIEAVESTRTVDHELPGVIRSLHVDGDLVLVGVSSRTNLELVLAGPMALTTSRGEVTATRVAMWVDEPREVAAQLAPRRARRR